MLAEPSVRHSALLARIGRGEYLSQDELKELLDAFEDTVDFDDLLPLSFRLGKNPINVIDRRPMFRPMFKRNRTAPREIYLSARQIGKALDENTEIPTPDGFTHMGDLKVGDKVLSEDGTPTTVTFVTPLMYDKECYRIKFKSGQEITACSEHQWKVRMEGTLPSVIDTVDLLGLFLSGRNPFIDDPRRGTRHYIESIRQTKSVPVLCISVDHPSRMYLCGRKMIPTHNTMSMAASILMNMAYREDFRIVYVVPLALYANRMHHTYLGPMLETNTLPFPIQSKGSVNNVLEKTFTTGCHYHAVSCFSSPAQALGIPNAAMLAFDECVVGSSLIATYKGSLIQWCPLVSLKPGEIIVSFDENSTTKLDRVKSIKCKGKRPVWRITLANGNNLECTSNERLWTETGWIYLSQLLSSTETARCDRALAIAHYGLENFSSDLSRVRIYSTQQIKNVIASETDPESLSVNFRMGPVSISSIEYTGEQEVWDIETEEYHTYFAGGLAVHNCQDLNFEFIPQIQQTAGANVEYGWETYTGTARGIENTIQVLFDESSQNIWHMRCPHCGYVNVPTRDEARRMIQKAGIGCAKCSTDERPKLLNVGDGWWEPNYPGRETTFRGFHVPQIIVADRVRTDTPKHHANYIKMVYNNLHGINPYSPAKFDQEVLGISSEQGGRPITSAQIRAASTLTITDNKQVDLNQYPIIAGGADWGGSEITSFTVGALVGWHHTGKFHCVGAIRPVGLPDQDRHWPLANYFKRMAGPALKALAGDGGFVGAVQTPNLGKACNVPYSSLLYGSQKTFYKGVNRNFITLDRSTLLFILYTMIIEGKLLFPKDPAFEVFTSDLTAIIVEDVETERGSTRRYNRIPTRADDFVHALGYALFACSLIAGMDLPSMVGISPNSSVNAQLIDEVIGVE